MAAKVKNLGIKSPEGELPKKVARKRFEQAVDAAVTTGPMFRKHKHPKIGDAPSEDLSRSGKVVDAKKSKL